MNRLCKNCEYFVSLGIISTQGVPFEQGDCRLTPPTVFPLTVRDPKNGTISSQPATMFANVRALQWCGAFTPRAEETPR